MIRPFSSQVHTVLALVPALLLFCITRSAPAADQPLPVQVKAIFAAKCAECHSPTPANEKESRKARKKWSDFADLVELKSKHLEATVQPAKTTLWKSLDEKDMPPDGAKAGALTADELATIKRWIDTGAPTNAGPARNIDLVSDNKLLRIILADLLSDKVPEIKRQTTRYFTLANFYNNPDESEQKLDLYRQGLFKMVNSLSWQSDIVLPEKVDKDGVVWRINLRDLGWTEQLWEHMIGAYPYGIDFDNGVGKSISSLTSSKLPYLRADWFVFATSQPPFYHEFLGLDGPQGALAALEKRLNVNRIANIQNGNAARAAIQAGVSGVSRNNRLVERHGGSVGGYYWISYDFGSNLGEQDLPANPLGPPEAFHGSLVFQHKGGEIVFALPNHLQGYLLVKSDGTRLDTAPSDIVFDATSPSPRAGEIINGISCISCHDHGIKDKVSDEVRARAATDSARFAGPTRDLINALYKEKSVMDDVLRKDLQQFLKALDGAQCPSVNIEPVRALFDRFAKSNVDASSAAAELGLGEAEFAQRLIDNGLRGLLSEFKGAGVPRDKFIDKFDKIVLTLSIGLHRPFEPIAGIRLVEPDLSTNTFTSPTLGTKFAMIISPGQQGTFMMGSPEAEEGRAKDETQHRVTLTKPYFMATHDITRGQFAGFVDATGYKTDAEKTNSDETWRHNKVFEQEDTHPVVQVSWNDAVAFLDWLSHKDHKAYRLPTEAEWEYACRAGTTTPFHTGATLSTDLANYNGNFVYGDGVKGVNREKTTPVGSFPANKWGLFDMHGNAWQWCSDVYGEYPASAVNDPAGLAQGASRVLRGGSYHYAPLTCRSASRYANPPEIHYNDVGFRVVLDAP